MTKIMTCRCCKNQMGEHESGLCENCEKEHLRLKAKLDEELGRVMVWDVPFELDYKDGWLVKNVKEVVERVFKEGGVKDDV